MKKKIFNLNELKNYCQKQKKLKKKIVLAHGTFDLLHIGHIKHLKYAKNSGDILIVTITPDKYVKKGPNRPYFNQVNRAEMLSTLDFIDKVSIVNSFSAIPAIENIKPNYYIKGIEYKNENNDLTKKISHEKSVLNKHGGKIIYSNEETFSSSNLLNNFFSERSLALKNKIKKINKKNFLKKMLNKEKEIENIKICLIGDSIFDVYRYVSPMGKSPKENMISNLFEKEDIFCGGILAAANNLSSFCNKIDVVSYAYSSNKQKKLIKKSLNKKINLHNFKKASSPVTTKIRYVEKGFNRKLFSVYKMEDNPINKIYEKKVINFLNKNLNKYDLVIVTDFGHGFISEKMIDIIRKKSKFLCVNAQSNSANYGFNVISKYKKTNYGCIDLPEAKLAIKNKFKSPVDIALTEIPKVVKCDTFALTLGKNGSLIRNNNNVFSLEALNNNIIDTMGAGDAFFVITSLYVYKKFSIDEVALIGNCAGSLKVNILGHEKRIEKEDLLTMIKTILM